MPLTSLNIETAPLDFYPIGTLNNLPTLSLSLFLIYVWGVLPQSYAALLALMNVYFFRVFLVGSAIPVPYTEVHSCSY